MSYAIYSESTVVWLLGSRGDVRFCLLLILILSCYLDIRVCKDYNSLCWYLVLSWLGVRFVLLFILYSPIIMKVFRLCFLSRKVFLDPDKYGQCSVMVLVASSQNRESNFLDIWLENLLPANISSWIPLTPQKFYLFSPA